MKRQTANRMVALSLLGVFLLSAAGCGGAISSLSKEVGGTLTPLSKEEFQEKAKYGMPLEQLIKWLGKPTKVTDDDGMTADWHYSRVCYDKMTGKVFDATIAVVLKAQPGVPRPQIRRCDLSSSE